MKKVVVLLIIFIIVFSLNLNAQEDRALIKARINNLQRLIDETNAGWKAGETSVSRMPLIEFQKMLGLNFNDVREVNIKPVPSTLRETPNYVNLVEKGYITNIKDQGHCGSCYAFASCALLESYYLHYKHKYLDLSEQYFMMKTKVGDLIGGCKGNSLWVCAATCLLSGTVEEYCCPYKAQEEPCPNNCDKKYKALCVPTGGIENFQKVLAEHGPIVAGFMVYEDFRDYVGGVYRYVHGKFLGGHAVLIVGYNKEKRYWIVKNSWGTDWGETCDGKGVGERGYFRIAFGECSIESYFMGPFYAPNISLWKNKK